jgi:lipoate-protein ligase A
MSALSLLEPSRTRARTPVEWQRDPPARGTWNMALDEALVERAADGGSAVFRLYQWSEPTLSLGYFQRYADRALHPASAHCAVVRRASGGGAILHDRELTYSCVLPSSHPLSRRAADLYYAVHDALVAALAQLDIPAAIFAGDCRDSAAQCDTSESYGCGAAADASDSSVRPQSTSNAAEPFLCFAHRTPGDVLLDGRKIAGSAQRRHRGAVLQHGSIVVEQSAFAPEVPGIQELTHRSLNLNDFTNCLRAALAARAGFDFASPPLAAEITSRAVAIETAKFGSSSWLHQR